jgi:hypothetical protein
VSPTLNGRIQTRIFLVLIVGGLWTVLITPVVKLFVEGDPTLSQVYKVTFTMLIIVLVVGIAWEFVYHVLQQFRWEKDWPTLFGYATGINEGIVAYVVAKALATTDPGAVEWRRLLEGLTVTPFLVQFVTTWIVINLFAGNFMKAIFLRWRYRGGRLIGGW